MKTKFIALFAIFLSAAVGDVRAQTVKGAPSCGQWIQEVQHNGNGKPDAISSFWMLGYLSGKVIATEKNVIKDIDSASIYGWITNYCRASPLNNGSEAGDELFKELVKRKGL